MSCEDYTGIEEYSAFPNRSVINCAEIWNARESILNGINFEDIDLTTYHLKSNPEKGYIKGDLFHPCDNCQKTFEKILKNLGG